MFGFVICLAMLGDVPETTTEVNTTATRLEATDAARKYRILVYNELREQRPEYDIRFADGQTVLKLSKRLPKTSTWQRQIVRWYDDATTALLDGETSPAVPDVPENEFESIVDHEHQSLTTPTSKQTPRQQTFRTPDTTPSPAATSPGSTNQGSLLQTIGGLFGNASGGGSATDGELEATTNDGSTQPEIEDPAGLQE